MRLYFLPIMKSIKFILPALAFACALPAGAVRAIDKFIEVRQPDGSVISVKKCGDESFHYLMSTDGALLKEENGAFYFAKPELNGQIVSTGVLAADPSKRSELQRQTAVLATPDMSRSLLEARQQGPQRVVEQSGMGRFTSNFPRFGDIRGLVILVSYKDVGFQLSDPYAYFNGLLNEDGFSQYNATGCAAEYFRSNSNDQFRPVFDVLGPVQLPQTRSYYGGNDMWGNDLHPEDMVIDAVHALDDEVDFSIYDMDGDGQVDNVFIIYAGQGEASYGSSSTVWPHSWKLSIPGKSFSVDGVVIETYGCSNEWELSRPDGVGTFVHEFSHVMGLPDLYATNNSQNLATPQSWSVLDYGPYNNNGCTPPNYSAYERLAMGWLDPIVLDGPESISLKNLDDENQACIIQTPKSTEYYLFENRQQKGWDYYLPHHGMLIWHVDFVQSIFDKNVVNNQTSHMYVELKKASGQVNAANDTQLAGWAWPGTTHKTEFTDDTTPSMKTWSGKALELPITKIVETEDGLIQFDVAGGREKVLPPVALVPVEGSDDWFDAAWEPVENAVDYYITVMECVENGEGETYINDMGEGQTLTLPEGWTSSHNSVYTTNTNYGASAPSYKMSVDNSWIASPMYDSEITKISLWTKGQQSVGNHLIVTGKDITGNEVLLASLTPNKSSVKTEVIEDIPLGICQVIFTFKKEGGNLAIDDIEITTNGRVSTILEDYNHLSTNGETSMRVNHAINNDVTLCYFVEATDGEFVSRRSETITVPEFPHNSVDVVKTELDIKVNGRQVTSSTEYEVLDISGSRLFSGKGSCILPNAGVYLVRQQDKTVKVMVK